jgi:hypothetical protein
MVSYTRYITRAVFLITKKILHYFILLRLDTLKLDQIKCRTLHAHDLLCYDQFFISQHFFAFKYLHEISSAF